MREATRTVEMTEAEAWTEIARRILEGEWEERGICLEVYRLWTSNDVSDDIRSRMARRVDAHVDLVNVGRVWQSDYAYDPGCEPEARALACLWMALEAQEDKAR